LHGQAFEKAMLVGLCFKQVTATLANRPGFEAIAVPDWPRWSPIAEML